MTDISDEGFLPDDLSHDGLHLKTAAYRRWADAVLALPGLPASLPRALLQRGDRGRKGFWLLTVS